MMPLFEQVLDKYPTDVKIVFKHFPLSFHQQAMPAALASMAAEKQGRFWEYHDELFRQQASLSQDKYLEIAGNMDLDLKQFSLDMMRPSIRNKIDEDISDGKKAGISGTPSIFVNGRILKRRDLDAISSLIDSELGKLK